jgi:serine/threonine protein phosphatase PrpC
MYDWTAVAGTDTGRIRTSNEDTVFADVDSGTFIMADGMGGRAAGEVASAIACRIIGAAARARDPEADMSEPLVSWFLDAGSEVSRQAAGDPALAGMGTTCTVLLMRADGVYVVGHIGDSRAYLRRGDTLLQVTRDHSWVQDQVDRGLITRDQARGHPSSNLITRAIGIDAIPTPDIHTGQLQDGDEFLLASDGLTDMLDDARIGEVLASEDSADTVVERLVAAANEAGGSDNISSVLVRVRRLGR